MAMCRLLKVAIKFDLYDDKYGKFELTARLVFLWKLTAGQD